MYKAWTVRHHDAEGGSLYSKIVAKSIFAAIKYAVEVKGADPDTIDYVAAEAIDIAEED